MTDNDLLARLPEQYEWSEPAERAARRKAALAADPTLAADLAPDPVLVEACEKRGLPVDLAGLIRHIENNTAVTIANWKLVASIATEKWEAAQPDLALAAAVRRLTDAVAWTLRGGPDGDPTEAWNTQTGAVGTGPTIEAAITSALDADR